MVKEINKDSNYDSKSVYDELKEFHDINKGELYSYQDFEKSGLREYKTITNKIRGLYDYEKNRLADGLLNILISMINNNMEELEGYLTLNPIINYYDRFILLCKSYLEENSKLIIKFSKLAEGILLKQKSPEIIKMALLMIPFVKIEDRDNILEVFSIHNDYIFYVINSYKYMPDANKKIFKMAKISAGYGRVFCVMELEPSNDEICRWLIEEGSDSDMGVSELVSYSMLSVNLLKYLENTKFDRDNIEKISKSFSIMFSEYGVNELQDEVKVCRKMLSIINDVGGGIYSLYVVISILYSVEAIIIDSYEEGSKSSLKVYDDYKLLIEQCRAICDKEEWKTVIENEISNIEIEVSVIIACIEKLDYKIKKKEFEAILKRDYVNPLVYKYAFSIGNKSIKKYAFNEALEKLPMDEVLSGQDEIKLENVHYEEIYHICYFIIVKYLEYEDFKDEYKDFNIKSLKSPIIETRTQAVTNLQKFKNEFSSEDKEEIEAIIANETILSIRRGLNSLLVHEAKKIEKHVDVSNYMDLRLHVRDVYLTSVLCEGEKEYDRSSLNNNIFKDSIVFFIEDPRNINDPNTVLVAGNQGVVIGYLPKQINYIVKNLIDSGKCLYGKVEKISDDYEEITIEVYLSYKDVIDEIGETLTLLSGSSNEHYIQ